MNEADRRPDPDELLARVESEEARQKARPVQGVPRRSPGVGKTYAMLDGRARVRQQYATSSSARGDARARGDGCAGRMRALAPAPDVVLSRVRSPSSTLTARSRAARRPPRRRARALERPGLAASQALARRGGAARGRDRRLHDAQRPAHREPQRRRRPDHRRRRARDRCPTPSSSAPTRSSSSTCRRRMLIKRLRKARSTSREQAQRALSTSSRRATSSRCASSRCARPPSGSTPRCRPGERATRSPVIWPIAERILVGIGRPPTSARLVRGAKRLAERLRAQWIVDWVEACPRAPAATRPRPDLGDAAPRRRARRRNGQLAGASRQLIAYAANATSPRSSSASRTGRVARLLFGWVRDKLQRGDAGIDIFVLARGRERPGQAIERQPAPPSPPARLPRGAAGDRSRHRLRPPARSAVELTNVVMVFLLAVVGVALRFGRGPSIFASIVSVAAFDFFFVPPLRLLVRRF